MREHQIVFTVALVVAATSISCDQQERIDQTRADLYVVAQAVALHHHRDGVCPRSIQDLVRADVLHPDAPPRDVWETDIRLSCEPPAYRATSAGPDREFGTDDDITATQQLTTRQYEQATGSGRTPEARPEKAPATSPKKGAAD